jgi:hypothetical protein
MISDEALFLPCNYSFLLYPHIAFLLYTGGKRGRVRWTVVLGQVWWLPAMWEAKLTPDKNERPYLKNN